jgi:hypothetical protein
LDGEAMILLGYKPQLERGEPEPQAPFADSFTKANVDLGPDSFDDPAWLDLHDLQEQSN